LSTILTSVARPRLVGGLAALGIATVAMAIYNLYREKKLERAHPPAGRFITVDGVKLHFVERGAGPPVILIHGNIVTADDFAVSGVLDRIARNHRVIAFDRPGFGYSGRPHGSLWSAAKQADLLRKACSALGVERPVVLGHSYGSIVALELALKDPEAVSGLVLVSGYYYPTARMDSLLASVASLPIIGGLMRYTISPLLGAVFLPGMIKGMFAPQRVPSRFTAGDPAGLSVRPSQIRAENQDGMTMVPSAMSMRGHYAKLSMPVVIMAGGKDGVVDVGQAIQLHDDISKSDLRLVQNGGHMVHYSDPELVSEAVEAAYSRA